MKIAQFRDNVRPQLIRVMDEGDISATLSMYTRISEWVDVEFPQLPTEATLPHALRALDLEERELREKLSRLADARARLGVENQPGAPQS